MPNSKYTLYIGRSYPKEPQEFTSYNVIDKYCLVYAPNSPSDEFYEVGKEFIPRLAPHERKWLIEAHREVERRLGIYDPSPIIEAYHQFCDELEKQLEAERKKLTEGKDDGRDKT